MRKKVKNSDLDKKTKVNLSDFRLGSPVARPTKAICVGLNYAKHAKESGAEPPKEPVIFMKAPDTVVGGFDDIVIPPNSVKTDYEVEILEVSTNQVKVKALSYTSHNSFALDPKNKQSIINFLQNTWVPKSDIQLIVDDQMRREKKLNQLGI